MELGESLADVRLRSIASCPVGRRGDKAGVVVVEEEDGITVSDDGAHGEVATVVTDVAAVSLLCLLLSGHFALHALEQNLLSSDS